MKKAVLTQILRLADRNISWNQYYQDNSHLVHGVPHRPGETDNTFQNVFNSLEEDEPKPPSGPEPITPKPSPKPPPIQAVPSVSTPSPTQLPQSEIKDWKDRIVPVLGSLLLLGTGAGTYHLFTKEGDAPAIDPPAVTASTSRRSLLQSLEDGGYHVGGRENVSSRSSDLDQ